MGSREQGFAAGNLPPALPLLALFFEGFQPHPEVDDWRVARGASSPSSSEITILCLSSALVTFVIIYFTCMMMRQVIYARSVARLCCGTGIALNSLCEHTSVAVRARRTGSPQAVVHPSGRDVCQGVSWVLERRLGFPAPARPFRAGSATAGFSSISGIS